MEKSEKSFDCVKLMRELREKIGEELEGLTEQERAEYLAEVRERCQAKLGIQAEEKKTKAA